MIPSPPGRGAAKAQGLTLGTNFKGRWRNELLMDVQRSLGTQILGLISHKSCPEPHRREHTEGLLGMAEIQGMGREGLTGKGWRWDRTGPGRGGLWDTGRAESQLGNRGEIIFTLNDM